MGVSPVEAAFPPGAIGADALPASFEPTTMLSPSEVRLSARVSANNRLAHIVPLR